MLHLIQESIDIEAAKDQQDRTEAEHYDLECYETFLLALVWLVIITIMKVLYGFIKCTRLIDRVCIN